MSAKEVKVLVVDDDHRLLEKFIGPDRVGRKISVTGSPHRLTFDIYPTYSLLDKLFAIRTLGDRSTYGGEDID